MPLITLTTDFGTKDFYVSALKGTLHQLIDQPTIIDITHSLKKFDTMAAAVVLTNAIEHFPAGTIHIIDVTSDKGEPKNHVLVTYRKQYFIGCDNGIISLITNNYEDEVININRWADRSKISFPALSMYCKVAAELHKGATPAELGKPGELYHRQRMWSAQVHPNHILGTVIYLDDYGNAITNITREMIEKAAQGRSFTINFKRYKQEPISEISNSYNDVEESYIVALYTINNYLEIAVNQGNVSKLYGLLLNDTITIEFNDHTHSENDLFA